MQNKQDLIIMALQERIGQIAAEYETKVALLRAEITMLLQENESLKNTTTEKLETTELHSV